jgi:hypothetical protein
MTLPITSTAPLPADADLTVQPGQSSDADLEHAVTEILKHAPEYQKAYRYWRGKQDEVFASPNLRAQLYRANQGRYDVSIGKRVVSAVTDRLEVTSVDVDDTLASELEDIQISNHMDIKQPDLFQKAVTYGDMYVTVWPEPGDDSEGGESDDSEVEIVLRSPEVMRAFYDDENEDKLLYVGLTWLPRDQRRRVTLFYDDRIERYIGKRKEESTTSTKAKDYMPYTPDAGDPEGWYEPHDYGRVPVFHFRTATPYGISELEDVYGAQNLLTKQIVTLAAATEGYGWPLRAALSKAGTLGDRSAAAGWDDQQNVPVSSQLNARQRGPNIRTNPGDIVTLHDTDSLVSLPPADVNNFVQPIELALTLVNTVSGKNIYSHNSTRADASGVAQQERDRPLVKIVQAYQRLFGAALKDMFEFALLVRGHADAVVTLAWSEAQLVDDIQSANTAIAKQSAGVPQDETLVEMGYLPKKVEEWSKGTELTNLETRVKLVSEIGAALGQLGGAQQLGVVSPEIVNAVLQFVLQGIISEDDPALPPDGPAVPPAPMPVPMAPPVPTDGGGGA